MKLREFIRITAGGRHAWVFADIGGAFVKIRKPNTTEVLGLTLRMEHKIGGKPGFWERLKTFFTNLIRKNG